MLTFISKANISILFIEAIIVICLLFLGRFTIYVFEFVSKRVALLATCNFIQLQLHLILEVVIERYANWIFRSCKSKFLFRNYFMDHLLVLSFLLLLLKLVEKDNFILLIKWHASFVRALTTRGLQDTTATTSSFNSLLSKNTITLYKILIETLQVKRITSFYLGYRLVHLIICDKRTLILADTVITL